MIFSLLLFIDKNEFVLFIFNRCLSTHSQHKEKKNIAFTTAPTFEENWTVKKKKTLEKL